MENIPDGTFTATVNGFIDILKGSKNPLQEALDIYNGLKDIKRLDDLSNIPYGDKIERFLTKNKMKIKVGIAIIETIIHLLSSQPTIKIDINIVNKQFYYQYNQVIRVD